VADQAVAPLDKKRPWTDYSDEELQGIVDDPAGIAPEELREVQAEIEHRETLRKPEPKPAPPAKPKKGLGRDTLAAVNKTLADVDAFLKSGETDRNAVVNEMKGVAQALKNIPEGQFPQIRERLEKAKAALEKRYGETEPKTGTTGALRYLPAEKDTQSKGAMDAWLKDAKAKHIGTIDGKDAYRLPDGRVVTLESGRAGKRPIQWLKETEIPSIEVKYPIGAEIEWKEISASITSAPEPSCTR
jgi:hypothetical protein